jgi:hypothetical protein
VFSATESFSVGIGEQGTEAWQVFMNLRPTVEEDSIVRVTFDDANDE